MPQCIIQPHVFMKHYIRGGWPVNPTNLGRLFEVILLLLGHQVFSGIWAGGFHNEIARRLFYHVPCTLKAKFFSVADGIGEDLDPTPFDVSVKLKISCSFLKAYYQKEYKDLNIGFLLFLS